LTVIAGEVPIAVSVPVEVDFCSVANVDVPAAAGAVAPPLAAVQLPPETAP
jgi:hypothetical protein